MAGFLSRAYADEGIRGAVLSQEDECLTVEIYGNGQESYFSLNWTSQLGALAVLSLIEVYFDGGELTVDIGNRLSYLLPADRDKLTGVMANAGFVCFDAVPDSDARFVWTAKGHPLTQNDTFNRMGAVVDAREVTGNLTDIITKSASPKLAAELPEMVAQTYDLAATSQT